MTNRTPQNRLREIYEKASMRRSEVAAICKVGERTVYRWERGEIPIPDQHKLTLASYFGVSPEYLAGWDRPSNGQTKAAA